MPERYPSAAPSAAAPSAASSATDVRSPRARRSRAARAIRAFAGLALMLLVSASVATSQDLIGYWSFNSPAPTGNPWPQPVPADHGEGTITYTFTSGVTNFAGTTINAREGAIAGQSFAVQGGTALANNGRHFDVNFSTRGHEDIVFSYATRGTASGFNSQRAEFSVDGGQTWTFIGQETDSRNTSFFLVRYDLSGFTALNNAANAIIRITLNGATNDTGNNRFDNIAVEGTFVGGASGTGTGVVTLDADPVPGGQVHALEFTLAGRSDEPIERLSRLDFMLPEGWGPITPDDVTLDPAGGTVEVDGRTVRITGLDVSASEPVTVRIQNLWVADETGSFRFAFRTASGAEEPVVIASQPALLVYGTPVTMAEASRNHPDGTSVHFGQWLTIRGVVTVADQFGAGPTYLQDETGGFAVYSPSGVTQHVEIGDEVTLFGRVTQFYGLNQLGEEAVIVDRHGRPGEPEPQVVTLAQLAGDGAGGVEVYEGSLVRVNNVQVNTSVWTTSGGGFNYLLTDATGSLDVRIVPTVDFAGEGAPSGLFDIIGVVGQFVPPGSPTLIGGYQLLPRKREDIVDASLAPAITSRAPYETAATATSIAFDWTTSGDGTTEICYGLTPEREIGCIEDPAPKSVHSVVLEGLDPATIYHVQLRSAVGADTTRSGNYIVSTSSPEGTTGEIRVYFNQSVDTSIARDDEARGNVNLVQALVNRINAAQHSVDIALYSLSGTAGATIANALIAAHNRGVRVRVIMDESTSETAPPRNLRNAGVPFITDGFGANVGGEGLHHNKVAIIDADLGEPHTVWVMNGSWNPTDPGSNDHRQNVVWIQDVALARAYRAEFEQMWGSSTATPNSANSRFGANKQLVNPTTFWVDGTRIRLFFSPQGFGNFGPTEQQMLHVLAAAELTIDLGLNLITRQDPVNVMRARHDAGVEVRGVIGDISYAPSLFESMATWADVHDYAPTRLGLFHHKYALVDAEAYDHRSVVITGSHNWSRAANERNDENTLIIYSPTVANQFLQEFKVRYHEAGGQAAVSNEEQPLDGAVFSLSGNYPNPFTTTTTFRYQLGAPGQVTVRVYDLLGREVAQVLDADQPAGTYNVSFDGAQLSSGVYLYRVEATTATERFVETRRMVIVR
jgi:phosphatidylserine/phosphatidylglycerophosphate/cardiolipin synthase-like enzyme